MRQILAILLLGTLAACSNTTSETAGPAGEPLAVLVPGSGDYSRPISTDSAVAQQFFDQGLRLAWGFYFPESIASYQEASRQDPTHPMPHWGMAHAMGPNPNSRYAGMPDDPKGEGGKAIRRAMVLIDRATELEAELIRALHVLYNKDSIPDDAERDRAYLAAMRDLNKAYPDDADVAALYAGAYMSIGKWNYWDKDGNALDETIPVAQALERIIENGPAHPGVLHLHVHLIEASMEPERALVSADTLEATMPIAGHVVHMPSHIYVRVGQYQKAIDSNVRSQKVDKEFANIWGDNPLPNIGTYPLSHKMHAGHAIDFVRYAATVQGNYEVAIEAAHAAKALASGHRGQKRIVAPWLVDKIFARWDNLLGQEPSHTGMPYVDGIWAYVQGSAMAATGDMAGAKQQLAALRELATSPEVDLMRAGATPVSAVLVLASLGLEGEIAQASGDLDAAINAFTDAVALEEQNNYTEPPDWAQPMRHYLGAVLIEAGRYAEAEAVYRKDLRWNQDNGWALFGLSQALTAQGKDAEAEQARLAWEKAWERADVTIASSRL